MSTATDDDLSTYGVRAFPPAAACEGVHVRLEPFDADRHTDALYEAFTADGTTALWDYLPYGPFADRGAFGAFAKATYRQPGFQFFSIVPQETGRAEGVCALFRADLPNGVIELGHIGLGPALQRTRAATEAFAMLMGVVFDDLGYRRFEWKCNAQNEPSKRAAERLGFSYEGLFRQHLIVKGRNRDTAWYSIIDSEWPALRSRFAAWLEPDNFDEAGRQRRALGDFSGT